MIILKIGGSIITEKDSKEPKVDYKNLNRICNEIKESFSTENINADLAKSGITLNDEKIISINTAIEIKEVEEKISAEGIEKNIDNNL